MASKGDGRQIVGAEVAAHCLPEEFEAGRLTVRADSTAWATQVRLLAPTLLATAERRPWRRHRDPSAGPRPRRGRRGEGQVAGQGARARAIPTADDQRFKAERNSGIEDPDA